MTNREWLNGIDNEKLAALLCGENFQKFKRRGSCSELGLREWLEMECDFIEVRIYFPEVFYGE